VSVFETPKRHDRSSGQENKANPAQNWLLCDRNPTKMWVDTVNGAFQVVGCG
jgi:hypothetical protein